MHLYDSWGKIRNDLTLESEMWFREHYGTLDINQTKKNLAEYQNVLWHQGYIPETFNESAPKKIIYLHVDVNSAVPTKEVLSFFLPKLEDSGVIIFDDYGLAEFPEARKIIDDVLKDQKGVLLKLPTAQAIYHHVI